MKLIYQLLKLIYREQLCNRSCSNKHTHISTIETNISTIETDISTIETNISTIETNISTIETDITTIETDITTIESDASQNKADISQNLVYISLNRSDIDDISSNKNFIRNLQTVDYSELLANNDPSGWPVPPIQTGYNAVIVNNDGWFREWAVKPRFYKNEVFKGLVTSDGNASGLVPTTNHQEEGTP